MRRKKRVVNYLTAAILTIGPSFKSDTMIWRLNIVADKYENIMIATN